MSTSRNESFLGDIADIVSSRMSYTSLENMPIKDTEDGYVKVLGIKVSDMNRHGSVTCIKNTGIERSIKIEDASRFCIAPDVIVFPKNGAAIATNKKRRVNYWSVFDPNIMGLRARNGLSQNYLFYWMLDFDLTSIIKQGPVPHFNKSDLAKIRIKYPKSIFEQDAIASSLDCIMAAITHNTDLLENSQELKRAAMHQLFTRGLRGEPQKETEIGLIPESWQICTLGECITQAQYGLSVRGASEGMYPILRMNCQDSGKVVLRNLQYVDLDDRTFSTFKLHPKDILFNRTNSYELVGRTALFEHESDAVFASYLIRLSTNKQKIRPEYLNHFLNWDYTQNELKKLASRGVSQANISASKLKELQIQMPAGLGDQDKITSILDAIDKKIDLHKHKKALLEELFKSLLHKLMTGEISVSDLDLSAIEEIRE